MRTVSEEEFYDLVANNKLTAGKLYRIKGFSTQIAPNDGAISLGHKIDLYVTAISDNQISDEAYAGFNSDGTDAYYEDNGVEVNKWRLNVSLSGQVLGVTK
jgi:hypothetical protein